VYLAGAGLLTGQEILDAKTRLLRESDSLKRLHYGLIDLTDVTELRVTRGPRRSRLRHRPHVGSIRRRHEVEHARLPLVRGS
jgi:hypothetical protein